MKDMVAPRISDGERRDEWLGLAAEVVLPGDCAGLGLEGDHEPPSGAPSIAGKGGDDLFDRAALTGALADALPVRRSRSVWFPRFPQPNPL